MFEQVIIAGGAKSKRVWTTCAGVTGQLLLVAGMVVAPMLWPQAIPQVAFTMLVPTAPQGRPAKAAAEAKPPAHAPTVAAIRKYKPGLQMPITIPDQIAIVVDKIESETVDPGGPWVSGTDPNGGTSGLVADVLYKAAVVQPEKPPVIPVQVKPAVAIQRVREGGLVKAAHLISSIEPHYPPLAIAAHIEGVVKLRGVIAIDGHIGELAVESGHPLLAPAAMEAVRQWRYAPTQLNSVPVEVETTISVTFRLNR